METESKHTRVSDRTLHSLKSAATWLLDRSRKLGFFWWLLWGVAVPSALVFAVGGGSYLLFTRVLLDNPPVVAKDPYKDVLQTVMALAAIGIGAFGLGAYRLLSHQVEEKVARDAERRLRIANAVHKIDSGLQFWHLFKISTYRPKEVRLVYINEAIDETTMAYENEAAGLSQDDPEVERLVLTIRNALAFYLYEKRRLQGTLTKKEQAVALFCLDYIEDRKAKYSDFTEEILDTIEKAGGLLRPATLRVR